MLTALILSVSQSASAREVVEVFEHHRIDELVVVDGNDNVLGLIDSQDLVRMKVI